MRTTTVFVFCLFLCRLNRCTYGATESDEKLNATYCVIGDSVIAKYPNNKYYGAVLERIDFQKKRVRVKWNDNDPNHRWIIFGSVRKVATAEKSTGLDAYPVCLFKTKSAKEATKNQRFSSENKKSPALDRDKLDRVLNTAPLKSAIAAEMTLADVRDFRKQLEAKVRSYVSDQASSKVSSCSSLDGPFCQPVNGQYPLPIENGGEKGGGGNGVSDGGSTTLKSVKLASHAPAAGRFQMIGESTSAEDDPDILRLKSDGWVSGHRPENFVPVGLVLRRQKEVMEENENELEPSRADDREEEEESDEDESSQSMQPLRPTVVATIIDESIEPWGTPMQECSKASLSLLSRVGVEESPDDGGGDNPWFVGLWGGSYECYGLLATVSLNIYDGGRRAFFDFITAPTQTPISTTSEVEDGGNTEGVDGGTASAVLRDLLLQLTQEIHVVVDEDGNPSVQASPNARDADEGDGP
eukprot:g2010.t1